MHSSSNGDWIRKAEYTGERILQDMKKLPLYAVIQEVGESQTIVHASTPRWIGADFLTRDILKKSRSAMFAPWKASSLVAGRDLVPSETTLCSSKDGGPGGPALPGGLRRGQRIVALSGAPGVHDRLIASAMLASGILNASLISGWDIRGEEAEIGLATDTYPVMVMMSRERTKVLDFVSNACEVVPRRMLRTVQNGAEIVWVERPEDDNRTDRYLGFACLAA